MGNLDIYNVVRSVPDNALKPITGGRLKGKTDISPMWRLKTLTEQFGPCGLGWKYAITKQWTEPGANNEIAAFVNIELFIKVDGEWSDAIPGTGGSSFVTKETAGLYTSDECFKMALTDAISVSCKALGIGADVYWYEDSDQVKKWAEESGNVREGQQANNKSTAPPQGSSSGNTNKASDAQLKAIFAISKKADVTEDQIKSKYGINSMADISKKQASKIIEELQQMASGQ